MTQTFGEKNSPGLSPGEPNTDVISKTLSARGLQGETTHSLTDPAYFADLLNGVYIVVAEVRTADGDRRFRRRFYANLPSAQRAIDRAVMNGREAYLYIGQVTIVGGDGLD